MRARKYVGTVSYKDPWQGSYERRDIIAIIRDQLEDDRAELSFGFTSQFGRYDFKAARTQSKWYGWYRHFYTEYHEMKSYDSRDTEGCLIDGLKVEASPDGTLRISGVWVEDAYREDFLFEGRMTSEVVVTDDDE
jgi:hypothetical protein